MSRWLRTTRLAGSSPATGAKTRNCDMILVMKCNKCLEEKSLDEFSVRSSAKGTRHTICKSCVRRANQERYRSDEQVRLRKIEQTKHNNIRYREQSRAIVDAFKSSGCSMCEETDPCCIDAHHVDPSEKEFDIGRMMQGRFLPERVSVELEKCVPLCRNCHAKLHARSSRVMGAISPPSPECFSRNLTKAMMVVRLRKCRHRQVTHFAKVPM